MYICAQNCYYYCYLTTTHNHKCSITHLIAYSPQKFTKQHRGKKKKRLNLRYQNRMDDDLNGESKQKSRTASFLLPMPMTSTNSESPHISSPTFTSPTHSFLSELIEIRRNCLELLFLLVLLRLNLRLDFVKVLL